MNSVKPILTKKLINSIFNVNLVTGKVYWKNPPRQHNELKDKEAGFIEADSKYGYASCRIQINKYRYRRSKVVYCYGTGQDINSKTIIDHINNNPLDDSFLNLRIATIQQNGMNKSPQKNKKNNLPMGVNCPHGKRYCARIRVNKKLIHLGYFDKIEDAEKSYQLARKQHFGEFA